jgi:hypothetical protein
MRRYQTFSSGFLNVLLLAMGLLFASCGGGDGGGGGTPPGVTGTTLTGTVTAPNGSLAKVRLGPLQWIASLFVGESFAQASQGVGTVNILVFEIDDLGRPLPPNNPQVLAQAVTNPAGHFTVTLPTGKNLATNLIVQASSTTVPASIGSLNVLNCPAIKTTLRINPATEVGTRQLLGTPLSNFTRREVEAFIGFLQHEAQDIIRAGLENTVQEIHTQLQTAMQPYLDAIRNPGEGGTSLVSGTFELVRFLAHTQSNSVQRSVESNTLTFDQASGTVTGQVRNKANRLDISTGTGCGRNYIFSPSTESRNVSGSYLRTGNNQLSLFLTNGETLAGYVNAAGTVAIFSFKDVPSGLLGFGVAIKKGSGVSVATVQGTYNMGEIKGYLTPSSGGGSWPGTASAWTGTGTVQFNGNNYSVNGTEASMRQIVSCDAAQPFPITATLTSQIQQGVFTAPFSLLPDGTITLTDPTPGYAPKVGTVSADGSYMLAPSVEASETKAGYIFLARAATGLTPTSLQGTYHVIALGDTMTSTGTISKNLVTGTAVFDPGAGTQTFNGSGISIDRTEELCSGSGCASINLSSIAITESRTYTVTPDGVLQITSPTLGQLNGVVSPDASVAVVMQASDNVPISPGSSVNISRRSIAVAVKAP